MDDYNIALCIATTLIDFYLIINRSIMFSLPLFGRRTVLYNAVSVDFCFRCVTV